MKILPEITRVMFGRISTGIPGLIYWEISGRVLERLSRISMKLNIHRWIYCVIPRINRDRTVKGIHMKMSRRITRKIDVGI